MEPFPNCATVALVSFLATLSPGPATCIVVRNSLLYSRTSGLLTSVGAAMALIIHLSYTLIGLGVVIYKVPIIYEIIKYLGVVYLLYLGTSGLISSFKKAAEVDLRHIKPLQDISKRTALTQGFLGNLLNPESALFFISFFSQFIDANTSGLVKFEYALINWGISLTWLLFLAYLITSEGFAGRLSRFRAYIDRVMGGALVFLGFKLLFA